jgi:hypothetical protein
VSLVDQLYHWTDVVLTWGIRAMLAWAFVDCLLRKAAAFPAADKLTKPAWLAILALVGVLGSLVGPPAGIISLVCITVASVYLADVRPAVREISGDQRW